MMIDIAAGFFDDSSACVAERLRIDDDASARPNKWVDFLAPSFDERSSERIYLEFGESKSSDDFPVNRVLLDRLEELKLLKKNWDYEGAIPIEQNIVEEAKRFICQLPNPLKSIPKVVPMTQGRLQLEWHRGDRTLELEFETPGLVHFLMWDSSEDLEEEYFIPSTNFAKLMDLITWFESGMENG